MPDVGAAVGAHVPLAKPTVERGVASRAVLFEVPLAGNGTLIGECWIVLHVLAEGERIGLQVAALVLGVEFRGGGVVIKLEELQLGVLALATRHRVHDRPVRVLHAPRGVDCRLRALVAVDTADRAGEHGAHHLDEPAKRIEEYHSEVVGAEDFLDSFGAELVAMLAHRVTELVDQVVDLAVGHGLMLGCGHGLGHGVILLSLLKPSRNWVRRSRKSPKN